MSFCDIVTRYNLNKEIEGETHTHTHTHTDPCVDSNILMS